MATHVIDLWGSLISEDGDVTPEPASVNLLTNDRYPEQVWRYADTSTKDGLGFKFRVPENYVGTPKFRVRWSTPNSGLNVVAWDVEYAAIAATESSDPSADDEAINADDTNGGATEDNEIDIAATAGNFAVGDVVRGKLSRDGTDVDDTLSADVMLIGFWFVYDDA